MIYGILVDTAPFTFAILIKFYLLCLIFLFLGFSDNCIFDLSIINPAKTYK